MDIDTLQHMQRHPGMYLPSSASRGEYLATKIIGDIMIATNGVISVIHEGSWWVVACEDDWIAGYYGGSLDKAFNSIVPFPERGDNAMHGEVLLSAYADDLVTGVPGQLVIVKGSADGDDPLQLLIDRLPCWKRLVAFRIR